jgi:coenzyme F420-0:L-glutamate ligase/coenzyme F420-1:gamma-L-glutamate ligase
MENQTLPRKGKHSVGQSSGIDLIKTRRSVRQFLPDQVPSTITRKILEAATSAPSAHNSQPWKFVVLTSAAVKHQLAIAMAEVYDQDLSKIGVAPEIASARIECSINRIDSAPLEIVLCLDDAVIVSHQRFDQEYWLAVQSVAVCGGYLLLAAHSEGLGGYWMCAPFFAQQAVRAVLGLPASWKPQALFLLGYPAQVPVSPPKKSLQELVVYR